MQPKRKKNLLLLEENHSNDAPLQPLSCHHHLRRFREQAAVAKLGLICFNEEGQVLLVSGQGERFSSDLFDCRPRSGEMMPQALSQCVVDLCQVPISTGTGKSQRIIRKGKTCVRISLALDPEGACHCIIFEPKHEVTDLAQLHPLGLSPRETLVTYWIMHSKTNWEIGKILQISTRTVDKHVENIFLKLGVNDRRDLVRRGRSVCHP